MLSHILPRLLQILLGTAARAANLVRDADSLLVLTARDRAQSNRDIAAPKSSLAPVIAASAGSKTLH